MPTLRWIGKEKIMMHHFDVPLLTLEPEFTFGENSVKDEGDFSNNMIIHGDNLLSLKALLPKFEGKVNCIYIDPPYNTGNEKWIYNDNVNAPEIKKWLGKIVGTDSEDLCRHDKWLCMMYPRLSLLQKLLSEDGFIFISINFADEYHNLRIICDEIFGSRNYIGTLTWESVSQPVNAGSAKFNLQQKVEAILLYVKNKEEFKGFRVETFASNKTYPEKDALGSFRTEIIEKSDAGGYNRETMKFPILGQYPRKGKRWQIGEQKARELEQAGRLGIYNGIVKRKIYPADEIDAVQTIPFWSHFSCDEFGSAMSGKKTVNTILGRASGFDTVKPVQLIKSLISHVPNKNAIILDCFAGTGTLAQAVLELNSEDNGERRFICIEKENYCKSILEERIRRVITGYQTDKFTKNVLFEKQLTISSLKDGSAILEDALKVKDDNALKYDKIEGPKIEDNKIIVCGITGKLSMVPGIKGSYTYYRLGKALFDENGCINKEIDIKELISYIWHSETHSEKDANPKGALIGVLNGTAYYLFYDETEITKFSSKQLSVLTPDADSHVVYADKCLLSKDALRTHNIVFKKIPRDVAKI